MIGGATMFTTFIRLPTPLTSHLRGEGDGTGDDTLESTQMKNEIEIT